MIIKEINGKAPQIPSSCFIAENATVVGEAILGEHCSIWYGAIIRADVNSITFGDNVNIQDGAVVHCTYGKFATTLGNDVSVGHNAIVHGCTIADNVLIGMGSIVMDNCVVNSNSIIAAGAVVKEGTIVESGAIYAGIPAKKVKDINNELATKKINDIAKSYVEYSSWHKIASDD